MNRKLEFSVGAAVEARSLGDRPRASALWLSLFLHCVVLLVIFLPGSPRGSIVLSPSYQSATLIPEHSHISFRSNTTKSTALPLRASSRVRPAPTNQTPYPALQPSTNEYNSTLPLREQAQQETAAITHSLKFRGIYGFYPGHDYQLPVHQSGELPSISLKQFPDQVAQYVIVEIVIDNHGTVADAQIVTGMVVPDVQKILLAAIREFKYIPAKRDGIPIPSQLNIVVPLPS